MMPTPLIKIVLSAESRSAIARTLDTVPFGRAIARGMDEAGDRIVGDIRQRISGPGVNRGGPRLQGPNIGVDTGHLRRSISRSQALVIASGTGMQIRSTIGSNAAFGGESVIYAAIHEYGGTIEHPARAARVRFVSGRFSREAKYQKQRAKEKAGAAKRTLTRNVRYQAWVQTIRARPYVRPEVESFISSGAYSGIIDKHVAQWARSVGFN